MKFFKKNKYSIIQKVLQSGIFLAVIFSFLFPVIVVQALDGIDSGITIETGIENPLNPELSDIPDFINALITIVLFVGVPIVTLAIIYSGFLFVQASGNSEKLGTAKKALLYSVIGAALLLGAFVLSEAIQGTVDQLK
jgi:uncharacterized membrane protein